MITVMLLGVKMLIPFLWFCVKVVIWVVLFAKLEAEIEGRFGWAAKLPTKHWRWDGKKLTFKEFGVENYVDIDMNTRSAKFIIFYITKFLGGKDFTIYHRVVDAIQFFLAHIFVYGSFFLWAHWVNLPAISMGLCILFLEIRAFGTLFLIWTLEDTLWFYVNPLAKESNHHKEWVYIGKVQLMEKGMFGGFIIGIVLSSISFGPNLWHVLSTYM